MRAGASLRLVKIFDGVSDAALTAIEKQGRWHSCAKGVEFIRHQDSSNDIVFILSGSARVNIYSSAGRVVTFRDIGPGEFVGEMSAIDGEPRSACIEALEPCTVVYLSSAVFWDILETEPAVLKAVLLHFTSQIRTLTGRVFEFSTLAVRNRIHAELLRLAVADPGHNKQAVISPAPTHAEIASRIATHREAVTRELGRLTAAGLLAKPGRDLIVTNLPKLAEMVKEVDDV